MPMAINYFDYNTMTRCSQGAGASQVQVVCTDVPFAQCTAPHYLAETIHPVTSRGTRQRLRSADTSTLLVPPRRRTTLGDRSFPAAAARAWNTLPQLVQDAHSLPVFRRELKTVLFQSSFPAD